MCPELEWHLRNPSRAEDYFQSHHFTLPVPKGKKPWQTQWLHRFVFTSFWYWDLMAEAENCVKGTYLRQKMVIIDCTLKVNHETGCVFFCFSLLLAKSLKQCFPVPGNDRYAWGDLHPSQIGCTSADITVCMIYLSISQYISSWHFLNYEIQSGTNLERWSRTETCNCP